MSLSKKNISIIQYGFSLIELLVVVAIIGILAGIAIVGYNSYVDDANKNVAEVNAKQLVRKIAVEKTKIVDFTTNSANIETTATNAANVVLAARAYASANGMTLAAALATPSTVANTNCAAANSVNIYVNSASVRVCYRSGSAADATELKAW